MATKMAVAFSVIFMADLEKRLLAASPLKPFVWKRFMDDTFSLWNIPIEEVSIFVNFANSFHPTIKFTCEMSSERAVFLDTEVFRGLRLSSLGILDSQTHFKPNETFQYTHFSSCHPFNTKKGFSKGLVAKDLYLSRLRMNANSRRTFLHTIWRLSNVSSYSLTWYQGCISIYTWSEHIVVTLTSN